MRPIRVTGENNPAVLQAYNRAVYVRDRQQRKSEGAEYVARLRPYAGQVLFWGYLTSSCFAAFAAVLLVYRPGDFVAITIRSWLKYGLAVILVLSLWYWVFQWLNRRLQPAMVYHVKRLLLTRGLLLNVMEQDAYERFPKLGPSAQHWFRGLYRPRLSSYKARMDDLVFSFRQLANQLGDGYWPRPWPKIMLICALPLGTAPIVIGLVNWAINGNFSGSLAEYGTWSWWYFAGLAIPLVSLAWAMFFIEQVAIRLGLADAIEGLCDEPAVDGEDTSPVENTSIKALVYAASDAEHEAWRAAEERKHDIGPDDPPDTGWG